MFLADKKCCSSLFLTLYNFSCLSYFAQSKISQEMKAWDDDSMPIRHLRTVQQDNSIDCGLLVFEYAERFIRVSFECVFFFVEVHRTNRFV